MGRARHGCFSRPYEQLRDFAYEMRHKPTKAEALLWERLREKALGHKFRRQTVIFGYIVDFCCPMRRLVIELDGSFHDHRGEYDRRRDKWLTDHGYRVIRFANASVMQDIGRVVSDIRTYLRDPAGIRERRPKPPG